MSEESSLSDLDGNVAGFSSISKFVEIFIKFQIIKAFFQIHFLLKKSRIYHNFELNIWERKDLENSQSEKNKYQKPARSRGKTGITEDFKLLKNPAKKSLIIWD